LISPLGSTFFGLTSEYRQIIFGQIHEIVFHGGGGYTWTEVYNMPIWLRNFTFNKMKEHFEKQSEQAEKQVESNTNKSTQIARPNIKPAYSTKASNK
jgi:hypothetical protein